MVGTTSAMVTTVGSQRPNSTAGLIRRLGEIQQELKVLASDSSNDEQRKGHTISLIQQEIDALEAWIASMAACFAHERSGEYCPEARLLAQSGRLEIYDEVVMAFVNMINEAAADGRHYDPQLLVEFSSALRSAHPLSNSLVASAIVPLTRHLQNAINTTNDKYQYQLIRALSAVLDAMNDAKIGGISDENLVEPLARLLEGITKSPELRLSQAANYAYAALHGIPSDVSWWTKVGQRTSKTVGAGAKFAGAVSTMDPVKLVDGLKDLDQIPDLAKSIIQLLKAMVPVISNAKTVREAGKMIQGPKMWYFSLRYTNVLIQGKCAQDLKLLLHNPEFPSRQDKNFLCGLCAQREQALEGHAVSSPEDEVIKVLEEFLIGQGLLTKHNRVRQWIWLIPLANQLHPGQGQGWWLRSKLATGRQVYKTATYQISKANCEVPEAVLLNKAWTKSSKARLFYADQTIRQKYIEGGQLSVVRLNGESLPMDQCYINLVIKREGTGDLTKGKDSLSSHLYIWDPPKDEQIILSDIFGRDEHASEAQHSKISAQRQSSLPGHQQHPMRILLRGQAGMGKSTLCKKLLYDFIFNDVWSHIIKRIVWLPLRNFKRKNINSVKQLLREEFFPDDELLMEALWADLEKDNTRTLFVLDGLDEVPDGIGSNAKLLQTLLNQPRVIVTTRPYAAGRDLSRKFDLELQTVGFYPNQVKEYISSVASKQAKQVRAYIRGHPIVKTLARIPIQLDALCITLKAEPKSMYDSPRTMTALYKSITECIWRQDAQRLDKIWTDSPITKENALGSYSEEIFCRVQGELNLLKELAFNGFYEDMDEFGPEYLKSFWKQLSRSVDLSRESSQRVQSNEVDTLSFLRTSNGGSTADTRTYHFMHRTFQEFFAAQYFVECWRSRKPLTVQGISPKAFLQKEKYTARYAFFWRFVSGLLDDDGDKDTLEHFFQTIQMEPLDLLGYSHQRLLINCLSEVSTSLHFRKPIEEGLKEWILFDEVTAAEAEALENALLDILRSGSNKSRNHILNCIRYRYQVIPRRIVDLGISWLQNDRPSYPGSASHNTLWLAKAELTLNDIRVLMEVNSGDDLDLRSDSALIVQRQRSLSEDILNSIKMWPGTIFGPTESRFVFTILSEPQSLEDEVSRSIDQRRNSHVSSIINFGEILRKQPELSDATVALLTTLLDHQSWVMRMTALDILKKHSRVSGGVLNFVTETIDKAAIQDLQNGVPKQHLGRIECSSGYNSTETIPATDSMFAHQRYSLRESALRFLAWGPRVSDAILEVVTEALEDGSKLEARNAAQTLRRNSPLPGTVLAIIAKQLKNPTHNTLGSILNGLRTERHLPDEILKPIVALFNIQDCGALLQQVGLVLFRQKRLSEEVLDFIFYSISNGVMEDAAARTMIWRIPFPVSDRYLPTFAEWLETHTPTVRTATIARLTEWQTLPDYIVIKVIRLVRNMKNDQDDSGERHNALLLLANAAEKFDMEVDNRREESPGTRLGTRLEEPSFIQEIHEIAVSLLGHADFRIQKDGILLLQRRRCWFPDILDKLANILPNNPLAFSALNKTDLTWSFQKELYPWLLKSQHRDRCAGLILENLWHRNTKRYLRHDSWELWSLYVMGDTCFVSSPGDTFSLKIDDVAAFKECVKKYKAEELPDMPPVVSGREANEEDAQAGIAQL